MKKEDIIRKLTSRKFILAVVLLTFGVLCVTGVIPADLQEQWKGIFVAAAGVIAYILAEGGTDIAAILIQNKADMEEEE